MNYINDVNARLRLQVLVGDPKQLPPTLNGTDSSHGRGLEYTMFERLAAAGLDPIPLRVQYRCEFPPVFYRRFWFPSVKTISPLTMGMLGTTRSACSSSLP